MTVKLESPPISEEQLGRELCLVRFRTFTPTPTQRSFVSYAQLRKLSKLSIPKIRVLVQRHIDFCNSKGAISHVKTRK
jgi:hypothetical protein